MKVTIEIPDSTLVMTYQYLFNDESFCLQLKQNALDCKALEEMKEANHDAENT